MDMMDKQTEEELLMTDMDPLWLILVSYFTLVLDVGEYEDYDRRGPMSPSCRPRNAPAV